MATKTITTTVTLHVKDEAKSIAFKYDKDGIPLVGKTVIIEVPPGQPATLDTDEADRIIARFGGQEIDAAAAAPAADPAAPPATPKTK